MHITHVGATLDHPTWLALLQKQGGCLYSRGSPPVLAPPAGLPFISPTEMCRAAQPHGRQRKADKYTQRTGKEKESQGNTSVG